MRRAIEVLVPGVLAAFVAVMLLLRIEASPVLATAAALGAAIPVSMIYAMLTLEETDTDTSAHDGRA